MRHKSLRYCLRCALFVIVCATAIITTGCALLSPAPMPSPEPTAAPTAIPSATPLPTAEVMLEPVITPSPTPEPTPEPTPFTIVWMTDTQVLSYKVPDALESMGKWIAGEREAQNFIYVLHTGDVVDNGFKDWQWENFDLALNQFKDVLPFFSVAGNHDIGVRAQSYEPYLEQPFLDAFPEEQKYEGGRAIYDTFSAGGTNFVVVGLGYGAAKYSKNSVLDWVDQVLDQYSDHVAIICFHEYMTGSGNIIRHNFTEHDRVVAAHKNVRLVLCGHSRGISTRYDTYDDDGDGTPERNVCTMMYNYQKKSQYGFLRTLRFEPETRNIEVTAYSPYSQSYDENKKTGERENDFVIQNGY